MLGVMVCARRGIGGGGVGRFQGQVLVDWLNGQRLLRESISWALETELCDGFVQEKWDGSVI